MSLGRLVAILWGCEARPHIFSQGGLESHRDKISQTHLHFLSIASSRTISINLFLNIYIDVDVVVLLNVDVDINIFNRKCFLIIK